MLGMQSWGQGRVGGNLCVISQPGAGVAGLSGPPQLWGEVSPLWAISQNLWGVKPKNMLCEPEKSDHHGKPLDLSPHWGGGVLPAALIPGECDLSFPRGCVVHPPVCSLDSSPNSQPLRFPRNAQGWQAVHSCRAWWGSDPDPGPSLSVAKSPQSRGARCIRLRTALAWPEPRSTSLG